MWNVSALTLGISVVNSYTEDTQLSLTLELMKGKMSLNLV